MLPKFSDGWSYLYVEHCRIDQDLKAIAFHDENGRFPVPCANLALLMIGPGVSITHAAISVLADHGCLVAWCGEEGIRFYASGSGETRSSGNLLHQAKMWANPELRMKTVHNLYQIRFDEEFDPSLTLQQIRGMEGIRIREAYAQASRDTGVAWSGRNYKRDNWHNADPINRALSTANSCLYGICHAAIVTAGFSPAIGFIHTGKMLSFVYDIADLYKADITIPVAFYVTAEAPENLEREVRKSCRDEFVSQRILKRIIPDIFTALMISKGTDVAVDSIFNSDAAAPGGLWDPVEGVVEGGCLHTNELDPDEVSDGGNDS